MEKKLYRCALLTGILGLLSLAGVLLTQASYPDLLFRALAPLGLLLIGVSIVLYVLDWVYSMKKEVKAKNYVSAALLLVAGIVFAVASFL